jgi:molybdopterin-guanine dinucleotide biosynthesis protein A
MADAIVLLAGGQARRFPRKLEQRIAGEPMIVRCFRMLRTTGSPVFVAANQSFGPEIEAALDAPRLADREPGSGPLPAFVSACASIRAERVFAVAADQPRLEPSVLERLAGAWQTGDEAVVPSHDGRIEPLAALYDRRAVLRERPSLERDGKSAMHDLVTRLAARYVPMEAAFFYNVNEPADLAAVSQT